VGNTNVKPNSAKCFAIFVSKHISYAKMIIQTKGNSYTIFTGHTCWESCLRFVNMTAWYMTSARLQAVDVQMHMVTRQILQHANDSNKGSFTLDPARYGTPRYCAAPRIAAFIPDVFLRRRAAPYGAAFGVKEPQVGYIRVISCVISARTVWNAFEWTRRRTQRV